MSYRNKIAFVALFCAGITSAYGETISFDDAWRLLQKKNSSIAAQRANLSRYQELEKAQQSLNLPSVTLGANYTLLDDDVTLSGDQIIDSLDSASATALTDLIAGMGLGPVLSGLNPVSTLTEREMLTSSIRAIWPVFTGGRITASQAIASGQTDEAKANLEMETQARFEDLARYYFSVVLTRNVLSTRESVENGLIQHLDYAVKLEKQGQIAKVERLQAQASLDQAKVERKKAQKDVEIAVSALTQILNQDQKVYPGTTLFVNRTLPPLNSFVETTLATYPGLKLLNARQKQAQNLIKAEQGNYYPQVYLYGNYTLYEEESLVSELAPDWMVGVGVSIPLIDSNGRSENLRAAKSAQLQVSHLTEQAKRDLNVLVEKTYFEAIQAIEEVSGLNSSISLATENLYLRKKAFSQGLSTSLDVVDAELYLAGIKTQQHIASFNYLISLNRLLALSSEMDSFSLYAADAAQTLKFEDNQ